jgi:hypothetical protein
MKKIIVLIAGYLFISCGSSQVPFTALKKPVDIALSSETIRFQSLNIRLAYVLDEFTQSIVVLDTAREEMVDTAANDDFDFTPIAVGGTPSSIVVDNEASPYRLYVTDNLNKKLLAYEIVPPVSGAEAITFKPVSLGGTKEGRASRALFKDEGSTSNPTLTNMFVDPDHAQNESWKLLYKGNGNYEVEGSRSGLQETLAREGTVYTSDNGEIKFYISSGGEKTTEDDKFYFSTIVTRPLQLTSSPVDMLIHDRKLYILTSGQVDSSIIVYDLDDLSVESTTLLPGGAIPTQMVRLNSKIYISNVASDSIYEFDINALTFAAIATGASSAIQSIGVYGTNLYLIHDTESKVSVWSLSSDSIIKTINITDFGNSFFMDTISAEPVGYIPNVSGNVDVLNLNNNTRIDTQEGDKEDFFGLEFYDVTPVSNPILISVDGEQGVVQSESWQMVFEGVVPNAKNLDGTISGNQLNATTTFQEFGVQAGDLVVLLGDDDEEFEIESVDSETTLTLASIPSVQGNISFEVRSNGTYVVVGSKSGVQQNRVTPAETYTSDNGAISLKTRPSFTQPESRGDFFTFYTNDNVDPIYINNQGMGISGVSLQNSEGKKVGYILEQTKGQVSIIDLGSYEVRRTL